MDGQGKVVTGMDASGNVLSEKGGKAFTVATSDMKNIILNKVDSKTLTNVNKIFTNQETMGKKIGTTFRSDHFKNTLRPAYEDEASLHSLIRKPLGMAATSFEDDLTSMTVTSAGIFKSLHISPSA